MVNRDALTCVEGVRADFWKKLLFCEIFVYNVDVCSNRVRYKLDNPDWRILGMKRAMILVVLSGMFASLCLGQGGPQIMPRDNRIVQLPEPQLSGSMSLEQSLAWRRSVRRFTNQPLTLEQIGQLAWAGQGITDFQSGFRTSPSAGSVYPLQLFIATERGMFVYHPQQHVMEEVLGWDVRPHLGAAAMRQEAVAKGACDIIIAGSTNRLREKYGNNAGKFMLLEAGHVAQNIQLQAVSWGLGAVAVGGFDVRTVGRTCRMATDMEPILIVCVGYPFGQMGGQAGEFGQPQGQLPRQGMTMPYMQPGMTGPRALLVVPRSRFREEELLETLRALDRAKIQTVITSTKLGKLRGVEKGTAESVVLLKDVIVDDFNAIVFIGGPGAKEYFDNRIAHSIVREAADKGKILGAICVAPTVLARAGVLKGVRATSFPSEEIKLRKAGAMYTGAPVERDGAIITANGPESAKKFGVAIAEALTTGR